MDWSGIFQLLAFYCQISNISPCFLILFATILAATLVCCCCQCYQCIRDRRRRRSQIRTLPQPLARLSLGPGCPHIANTKLAHSNNLAEDY